MEILTQIPVFEDLQKPTEALKLRKIRYADIPALFRILTKPEVNQFLSIEVPNSEDDIKKNIKFAMMDWNAEIGLSYCIMLGSEVIGAVNLYNIRWHYSRGEVGIYLDTPYWKKGYGTKILAKMIDYAFTSLGLHRLEARVYPENESSIRLFEKMGFEKEGVCRHFIQNLMGEWQDVIQYSLISTK